MPNQLAMIYLNLTNNENSSEAESARLSFRRRVEIKTLRRYTDMGYTRISRLLNLPRFTIALVCNEPETPKKSDKHPEIRAFNTPIQNRLIDFVESSAEARRMTWSEIIHH